MNKLNQIVEQLTKDFAASDNSGERALIQERIVALARNAEQQRDAAVAALRDIEHNLKLWKGTYTRAHIDASIGQAHAAIAAAEGSKS